MKAWNDVKAVYVDMWDFLKFPFSSDCEFLYEVFLWLPFALFLLLFIPVFTLFVPLWLLLHLPLHKGVK